MELQSARLIIDTLAQGIHPVTGEPMPHDSPYNAAPVIRALVTVSRALDSEPAGAVVVTHKAPRTRAPAPANAGKPWAAEDDAALCSAFDAGVEQKDIAQQLARTRFGIEQRLIKLGKLPPAIGGGRYGAAVTAPAAG